MVPIQPSEAPNGTSPARDELREYADRYGYTAHVNSLLDAYRAEVLRDAVVEQRAFIENAKEWDIVQSTWLPTQVVDLIDPDYDAATGGAA